MESNLQGFRNADLHTEDQGDGFYRADPPREKIVVDGTVLEQV